VNAALVLLLIAAVPPPSAPPAPPQVEPEVEFELESAPDPEPEPAGTPDPDFEKLVSVELNDGQVLKGRLLVRNRAFVTLGLGAGDTLEVPTEVIKNVSVIEVPQVVAPDGSLWVEDPNRSQYFFAHSAMLQRQKEWSLSMKELSSIFVSIGVFDFLSVEAGTAAPLYVVGWFNSVGSSVFDGANFLLGVRGGGQVLPWLHLATGVQGLILPLFTRGAGGGFPLGGLVSGTATFGSRDRNLTFAAGMPFSLAGPSTAERLGPPLLNLDGNLRISRRVALMTENWLYLDFNGNSGGWILINALGVRLFGAHFSSSLGLMLVANNRGLVVPFPVPIVDFTWNFY
jgi:hypothetical protein